MKLYLFQLTTSHGGGAAAVAAQDEEEARRLLDESYGGHIEGWRLTSTLEALPSTPGCLLLEVSAH